MYGRMVKGCTRDGTVLCTEVCRALMFACMRFLVALSMRRKPKRYKKWKDLGKGKVYVSFILFFQFL